MNVLMVPTLNSGVCYWRFHNFVVAAHRSKQAGFQQIWWEKGRSEIHPWQLDLGKGQEDGSWRRVTAEIFAWAKEADVIIVQMLHLSEGLELFYSLKEAFPNTPVLAEIDDNIVSTASYNPAYESYTPDSRFRQIALDQLRHADGVITTTPDLKSVYEEFNDNVYEINNSIDFEHWGRVHKKGKSGIRIGWAGGASHTEDLALIEGPMKNILRDYKDVKFVFIHGVPGFAKGLDNVECIQKFARIDKYPQFLASQDLDIGMAPLVDNSFNRGKSNLRWLEYSALGIPTVASNVGHFASTIKDGVDGLLANDPAEFESNLRRLIEDRKYRRKLGREAQTRVSRDFNVDGVIKTYISVLEEVIERGPVNKVPHQLERTEPISDAIEVSQ